MQMTLRRLYLTLMIALCLTFIVWPAMALEKQPSDEKVAVVNGTVITREDFDREMGRVRQQLARSGRPMTRAQLSGVENSVLENLITNELLYQETERKGIKVGEPAVNEQLNKIKKSFPNEEAYKSTIGKMNLSEADIITQIEKGLSIQQFVKQEFSQKVNVSDKDAKAYYEGHQDMFKQPEEIRASHILIKVDSKADESQKTASYKKISEIQVKIQKGGDFAALAKEFSQGPSNVKGGDLGSVRRGQMVKPFEEAAFALAPGEVSGIVETRFGYHLIKVFEKKPETTSEYGAIKDRLKRSLEQREVQKQMEVYIGGLKSKGKVERFLTVQTQ
jgi:peptidyl-prolyl cis-trans isomerase C